MVVTRGNKVVKLEDVISPAKGAGGAAKVKVNRKPKTAQPQPVPKGKPKSGRVWKAERKRFSSIVKSKGIKKPFEKKEALRKELTRIKQISREAKQAKDQAKEEKKERRRANLRRQEENRKKSEIVQIVKNPSKIKKMRKKALRSVETKAKST